MYSQQMSALGSTKSSALPRKLLQTSTSLTQLRRKALPVHLVTLPDNHFRQQPFFSAASYLACTQPALSCIRTMQADILQFLLLGNGCSSVWHMDRFQGLPHGMSTCELS